MAFDRGRYLKAKWEPKEEEVEIKTSDLLLFFSEGEKPVFKVRGLTYDEIAQANEASSINSYKQKIQERISAGEQPDVLEVVSAAMGLLGDVRSETVKRITHLRLGTIEPAVDQQLAVAMSERNPGDFLQITDRIVHLTAMGQTALVKQPPSGKTSTSSGAADSPKNEADSSSN